VRRVVITGLGTINSLGHNKEDSFENIIKGECGIDKITLFDATNYSVQIAGEVKDFNPEEVMDKKEVKKADRFIQLGIKSALEAMSDAKIIGENKKLLENIDNERFGISSAAGIGGLINIEKNSIILHEKGPRRISPFFIPSALVNMLGGFISIEHGLQGPNLSSVTACAAGTHAIIEACKTIMLNGADRMLVVGAETAICGAGIGGFAAMKALSTRNDEPKKASRPFDKDRNGFVMGEGSASLVLEDYESAKKRGAKIYAEVIGFGESGDANHITSPVVSGPYRAMSAALNMAKANVGNDIQVDYINAHGTSTPANDKNETLAIKQLFKDSKIPLISSTKGQIGHCLGAAGAIEAVISIMAMQKGILPPTINQENSDEDCDLDYIPNEARQTEVNICMSNSFGFGGTNGVVIFKKVD
jgi:3-oxoacyl-[acyl-carrier-protein] synthase II